MKKQLFTSYLFLLSGVCLFTNCSQNNTNSAMQQAGFALPLQTGSQQAQNGGFESQIKYGEHLVTIGACHDCHSPKKMTGQGMEPDETLLLSGHPAKEPAPNIDRTMVEKKGLIATQTLTAWVGPWGVSYAANLTSDKTGIGNWTEQNFINAIRKGKSKGVATNRDLLPPMPWQMYRSMTDEELKAIFAYLKSTKPVRNVVPAPQAPVITATTK